MPPENEGEGNQDDQGQQNGGDAGGTEEKKYTEADVQRIADQRATEAAKTREKNIRAALEDEKKSVEEKLSSVQSELERERSQREEAEVRAAFVSTANEQGVVDPAGAYAIINADTDTFKKKDGSVDWKKLREEKPYLFQPKASGTNAGSGRGRSEGGKTTVNQSMNSLLRSKAGYEEEN